MRNISYMYTTVQHYSSIFIAMLYYHDSISVALGILQEMPFYNLDLIHKCQTLRKPVLLV